jgi:hypothetical protein
MTNPLPGLDYLQNCFIVAQRHSLTMVDKTFVQLPDIAGQVAASRDNGSHPYGLPASNSIFGQVGDPQAQTWYLSNSIFDNAW